MTQWFNCGYCRAKIKDGWVCEMCSFMRINKDDPYRRETPSICGRQLQHRVDAAAAYEQMSTLWSTLDPGVFPIDARTGGNVHARAESKMSRRNRKLNHDANRGFTYKDFSKCKLSGGHPWKAYNR